MINLSSKYLEKAVNSFASFPGVGSKTALRYVLSLLKYNENELNQFIKSIEDLKLLKRCKKCFNISDHDLCTICSASNRDEKIICVVEDILDVIAIENTNQFKGLYHVLGGIISPMDGIGPNDLYINELIKRVKEENTEEIIMALSTTMEGDATNFYIYKKLAPLQIKVSTIARGVGIGNEIEYTDELTLGRSILNRVPFQNTFNNI